MRNSIIVLATLLLFSSVGLAQIKSATLTASGLTCSMCSKAIYKALEKVSFVEKVDVDVEKSTYSIVFKQGENVQIDDIKKAVQNAGFAVASMQVVAGFAGAEVFNDAHVTVSGHTFHFLNVPKQVLNGDKTITVVDKNYLPATDRKKYAQYTTMKCFETGVMGSCCPGGKGSQKRIYHVTL